MVLQSFTSFFYYYYYSIQQLRGKSERKKKKNHSRQNANEPGSYYDANEIPP